MLDSQLGVLDSHSLFLSYEDIIEFTRGDRIKYIIRPESPRGGGSLSSGDTWPTDASLQPRKEKASKAIYN
jgi:hypothetical protein